MQSPASAKGTPVSQRRKREVAPKRRRSSTGVLWAGALLSVSLGVVFYLQTDLQPALATFAALLGLVITLQIEVLLRKRDEALGATRQQRLMSRIEASPWLPETLDEMLKALASLEHSYRGGVVAELARDSLDTALETLRGLSRGRVEASIEDNSLIFELTREAAHTIRAISVESVDLDWWHSPAGQRYWDLNVEARVRSVDVERIFVYRTWTKRHDDLASKQCAVGIRVLRVQQEQLPAPLRVDMIVWDSLCGWVAQVNATGDAVTNSYRFEARDVNRMQERYVEVRSAAKPWTSDCAMETS
jgi:hypothetical protein